MPDIKPNVFPTKDGSDKKDLYVTPATTDAEAKALEEMRKRTEAQLAQMNKTKVDVPTLAINAIEEPKDVISPLAEPKWGAPYDLVPLPSKGKLYNGVRDVVRVSYMSGSDENILTSPNLLKSGKFLEVLIRRNLLEANLDYRKLHTGDRNALMVWLRSTAFGHMYSISIYNSKGEVEDIEFDLSTLKTIELTVDPDENGYFEHICPITKDVINFQFITVGDEEDIETMLDADVANGVEVNNRSTYTLQRQIVSVNGISDYEYIKTYIDNMRVGAIKAFRTYVNNIESGIDLNVQIRTSGGESITTFLPINVNFFWPDI